MKQIPRTDPTFHRVVRKASARCGFSFTEHVPADEFWVQDAEDGRGPDIYLTSGGSIRLRYLLVRKYWMGHDL